MSFQKNALSGASLALVAVLFAPLAARAADKTVLRPMFDLEQGWDSNIYNDSGGNEASLVTRFSPGLWIENSGELGTARLGASLTGRSVWEESDLSGVDGGVRGDFERKLTPRLSLFGNGYADYYSGYEEISEGAGAGSPGEVLLSEQPSWARNQLGTGLRYLLTPRTSFRLSGSAGRVNYEHVDPGELNEDDQLIYSSTGEYRDRNLWSLRAGLDHQLSARDKLSLSVDGDDSAYQDIGFGSNDSQIWKAELGWDRNWSPVWSTELSLGASTTDSRQLDVPQFGGIGCVIFGIPFQCPPQVARVALDDEDFSARSTGLVGSFAITRTFERSLIRLGYSRDTQSTGGSGRTNFDIDSFTLSLTHRLAERVKLSISGNYALQNSVSDELPSYAATVIPSLNEPTRFECAYGGSATAVGEAPNPFDPLEMTPVYQCFGGSSEEDRTYTILTARLDWQMRKHLNAFVVGRYYHSTKDQSLGSGVDIETEDFDKITLGVGLRYSWDVGL